jgi:uncharacterized protein (DUF58 family)
VFRGQGLNFEEVREYREGDDIRNVDWKVTARTGEPHLKVFREERERSIMLCIDRGPHMDFGTRSTFKSVQAARAAALIGWAANSLHDRVGGLLFGTGEDNVYFRPTKDRRALWRLLKALTTPGRDDTEASPELLSDILQQASRALGTGGLVFVIADFNREFTGLAKGLGQLRQHHSVVLVPVDDPADRELPDMGNVLFRAPDGELLAVDTAEQSGREAYRRNWERRREHLVQIATNAGCAIIPLLTDQDVHMSLMHGLQRRLRTRAFL